MAKNTNQIVGDRLRCLLKENGLKMSYFNKQLGKNRSYLSNVLTGSDSIDDSSVEFIANKLHTTPEYLKGETDQKEKPAGTQADELSEYDARVLAWFHSLPPKKRQAILEIGGGPKE